MLFDNEESRLREIRDLVRFQQLLQSYHLYSVFLESSRYDRRKKMNDDAFSIILSQLTHK